MSPSNPRVSIATPMYGGVCTTGYMVSSLKTFARLSRLGIAANLLYLTNESLITRARNELVRQFLESNYDYLMFIDADISFEGDAVHKLISADRDIVCGIYPKKEIDWVQVEEAAKQGKTNLKDYTGSFVINVTSKEKGLETDGKGLCEIHHGGTGFMLIKRSVFETLKPHVPKYRPSTVKDPVTGEYTRPLIHEFFATSIDENGCLLSEDYHFCELWRKHGGKIFANPHIKLEHIGNYTYGGDIMGAGSNVK